jgi:CDGSH iron-sulfur domain-containing protein 3
MSGPQAARSGPYALAVEAGRQYWWCACGRSLSQPLCDGSHRGSGMAPVPFTPDKDGELWLCGCKRTGTKPFCDGSHNSG